MICKNFIEGLSKIKLLREHTYIMEETMQIRVKEIVQKVREKKRYSTIFIYKII